MIFNRFIHNQILACVLIALIAGGCATPSKKKADNTQQVPGEEAIEATLSVFTQTADFARGVTEKTGNITEGMLETSTGAIKHIIVSLENLRKKTVETFGRHEVSTEVVGPAFIDCPYCHRRAKISDPPKESNEIQYTCPYCKKDFIVNWVE
ncbi:MAG: hypothetical protein RBU23_01465 [Candidatus Auribacterota bacterium]|jgi:uncharacterized Zn-finger protein|nr:hypothetical protein [Candidatus Auribacterota bacterium]